MPLSNPDAYISRRLRVDFYRNFAVAFITSLFLGFISLIVKDGVGDSIIQAALGQLNFRLMLIAFFPGLLVFSLAMALSALGKTGSVFSWCSTRIWDLNATLSSVASGVSLGLVAPVVSGDIPNLSFVNTVAIVYTAMLSVWFYLIAILFSLFSRSPESLIFVFHKQRWLGRRLVFSLAAIVGIVMLISMVSQSIQPSPKHNQDSNFNVKE